MEISYLILLLYTQIDVHTYYVCVCVYMHVSVNVSNATLFSVLTTLLNLSRHLLWTFLTMLIVLEMLIINCITFHHGMSIPLDLNLSTWVKKTVCVAVIFYIILVLFLVCGVYLKLLQPLNCWKKTRQFGLRSDIFKRMMLTETFSVITIIHNEEHALRK